MQTPDTENSLLALDELWQQRHLPAVLNELESALQLALSTQREYSLCWRLARLAHFRAMQCEDENQIAETLRFFEIGKSHAQKAVEENRHDVEGHFWLGVNALEWARRKSPLHAAGHFKSASGHIERAMNQDESYHFAGPLRVWGRIAHLKPLILGGSLDIALDIYRRALQIFPHNSTTILYYSEALLADQQKALARKTFHQIIEAQDDPNWLWEQARDRRLAQLHLQKMDASL